MNKSETFKKAEAIASADPLAADYVAQLDKLRAETPPKFHDEFDWFYEMAFVAKGDQLSAGG